ncbi:MAG TPA: response regulator [Pseudomonas sp.]|uniref:response regulator transcription factor n=1 Tax=Pseudomonas sp. TaxID=306 RepID=UPI002B47CD0D|nr:response regulator [Pseudomonas sp.]HKS15111.1 response regulator [Pseudomonas sp.]
MKKIAVIEDSIEVSDALADFCRQLGADIEVDQYFDRESAEAAIIKTNYNLLVLDIELPPEKNAGFGIIYTNVNNHKSPVMIVSGLDQTVYKNVMQQLDVWDYLEKPIPADGSDFISSALKVLRAKNSDGTQNNAPNTGLLVHDSSTGKITYDGKRLNLPQTAKLILIRIYENRGKLVPYEDLYDLVKTGKNSEAVRQHVKTIRDAFSEADFGSDHIATIRFKGFQWLV